MGDFFSFLLSLLTFGWLNDRRDAKAQQAWGEFTLMGLFPVEQCRHCDDDLWFDIKRHQYIHLSTNQHLRKDPYLHRPETERGHQKLYEEARREEQEEAERAANREARAWDSLL